MQYWKRYILFAAILPGAAVWAAAPAPGQQRDSTDAGAWHADGQPRSAVVD